MQADHSQPVFVMKWMKVDVARSHAVYVRKKDTTRDLAHKEGVSDRRGNWFNLMLMHLRLTLIIIYICYQNLGYFFFFVSPCIT